MTSGGRLNELYDLFDKSVINKLIGIIDYAAHRLLDGRFKSTGKLFTGVADGNTKSLVLENPSDSDTDLIIYSPTIRATSKINAKKEYNVDIDTEGDSVPVVNKNSDYRGNDASAQFGGDNETGSYSNPGTEFSTKVAGSSGGAAAINPGNVGDSGASNVIAPGHNIKVDATPIGSGADLSIDINFIEEPR